MQSFSERLRYVLYKRDMSQSEAARRCGISQQAMNYIIKNNLDSSKLAVQIANGLNLNPDWLISGKGKLENVELIEIPVIDNYFVLEGYVHGVKISEDTENVFIDKNYGKYPFAFFVEKNKIAICSSPDVSIENTYIHEYLVVKPDSFSVVSDKPDNGYQICEWRILNVDVE
ncbi:helix-turn-helix domain-containing protein [Enterobacter ludwigii]|uniref:helix-turn-helix domain-containing protein n=1 Tax=Enterobacter TaxID=547 RepID=UPI003BEEE02A